MINNKSHHLTHLLLQSLLFVVALFLLCVGVSVSAKQQKIIVPPWGNGANQQNVYLAKLLELALLKTESVDGRVDIEVYPDTLSLARFISDLKNNQTIDVIWTGTNKQREEELLPVYVSLLKNLNQYRVLLIRRDDQEKFSAINTLAQLRKLTAGSCVDWPSTDLLRQKQLPVIAINNPDLLFSMLKAKRFDYISRNVFEAWEEEKKFASDGLVVEKTLLLHGGVPYYFFVNKTNKKLAERIDRGLRMAMADGSFDTLLYGTQGFKKASEEINTAGRRVLQLNNVD